MKKRLININYFGKMSFTSTMNDLEAKLNDRQIVCLSVGCQGNPADAMYGESHLKTKTSAKRDFVLNIMESKRKEKLKSMTADLQIQYMTIIVRIGKLLHLNVKAAYGASN
jgi:hypothetical protein